MSFGSHGDADNESTVASTTPSFTNAANDYDRYWADEGVSVGPSVYSSSDDDDDDYDDEEQKDVVQDDRYGGSEYSFVLGMDGRAAAEVAKRWAAYV